MTGCSGITSVALLGVSTRGWGLGFCECTGGGSTGFTSCGSTGRETGVVGPGSMVIGSRDTTGVYFLRNFLFLRVTRPLPSTLMTY